MSGNTSIGQPQTPAARGEHGTESDGKTLDDRSKASGGAGKARATAPTTPRDKAASRTGGRNASALPDARTLGRY